MTRRLVILLLLGASVGVAACGGGAGRVQIPPGTAQADEFLYTRGQEQFNQRRWVSAREYFRQIVDNYPQSAYRPDAKLAVGDTFIGEGSTEALLLAINEFREFLTFYPTHPRADYAQFRIAVAHSEQMLAPERDQTATRDVIRELQVFIDRYPNSSLMPEAQRLLREARDRLSEASYRVGFFYFRSRWYPGAIDRFREILANDPEFSRRDAVYYHLAESLLRTDKNAEALPYFERLLKEFEQSEYLDQSRKRIAELKTQ
jgi:outer membrane protein assembly factor BamD